MCCTDRYFTRCTLCFKKRHPFQAARHSMSADLYFTSVSSFFFSPPIISEVAERNSTKIGNMVGSKSNLKTHVRNLGYPPTNRGSKNHRFGRLRNFTATLTAYIFGTKHDRDNLRWQYIAIIATFSSYFYDNFVRCRPIQLILDTIIGQ